MSTVLTSLFLLASSAHAVPGQFTHQGRLLEPDGSPLEGNATITFRVTDAETDGRILWTETLTVPVNNGFYAAVLGTDTEANPLDTSVLMEPPIWLELQLDGEAAMSPRSPIHAVPYATISTVSNSVSGGSVNASEVAIDGSPVIDASGNWVGPAPSINWDDLEGIPDDFADGSDDEYDSFAALGVSCLAGDIPVWDATTMDWSCEMDQDTLAAIACTDGELIKWSDSAVGWVCSADTVLDADAVDAMVAAKGYARTSDLFSGSFSDLSDVPATATTDEDTLGALDCTVGETIVKTETGWECSSLLAALDGDADGTFSWLDCDDGDASSTIKANDADCDGITTDADCNDADPALGSERGSDETCPAQSCASILATDASAASQFYYLDPDGSGTAHSSTRVYCDMDNDDGGWALVSVINAGSSVHVNASAIGEIGYPSDLSGAKLSDSFINALSGWSGSPDASVYRFTCNGVTDYLRYEVGWNSEATNGAADFTYRYACDNYDPCVPTASWTYYDGGTSDADKGGGSYPQFNAIQYQADHQNGCYHSGYYRDGLLWVR